MGDADHNQVIKLTDGIATFNLLRLLDICCNLIHEAFQLDKVLKVTVNSKLIEEGIIVRPVADPLGFHSLLKTRTVDQIEKFFVIFTGGIDDYARKESRRGLRNQIALKIFEEIRESNLSSAKIHTIHGHFKEFSSLITSSLREVTPLVPEKYRNLKPKYNRIWVRPPQLQQSFSKISLNSSSASSQAEISVFESFLSDKPSQQQQHGVTEESNCFVNQSTQTQLKPKETEKRKNLGRITCTLINIMLFLIISLISIAAILRNSSDSPKAVLTSECRDFLENLTNSWTFPPSVSTLIVFSVQKEEPEVNAAQVKTRRESSWSTTTASAASPMSYQTASTVPPPPEVPDYVARFSPPQEAIESSAINDNENENTKFNDTKFYAKELLSSFPRTLNISFSSSHVFSNSSFSLPCSSKVTGLGISGSISPRNLLSLLKTFSHVEYLSFSGDEICDSLEESFDRLQASSSTAKSKSKPPEILLESLRFLRLTNLPECKGIYGFLNEFTGLPNVETLVIDGVFISSQNSEDIMKLTEKIMSVKNFDFQPSNICPDCLVFSRSDETVDPWKSLEALRFHVPEDVGFQGFLNLKGLLQPSLPNLEYYESSVEIPSKGSLKIFKRLVNLRVMNATFNFTSNQTYFSGSFFSHFPVLRESFVSLKFNDLNDCRRNRSVFVSLTNLKRNVGVSKLERLVMTSNCEIKPVKGWSIPCFDFEIDNDEDSHVQTVFLTKCQNCGCSR